MESPPISRATPEELPATAPPSAIGADHRPRPRPVVRGVTFRAVLIGLICSAFFSAFTPYNDFAVAATYLAGTQFPISALFVLFVLVGVVNVVLRGVAPRKTFSQGELLTVWVMILVASGLPTSGMMRYFIPHIVAPHHFSNDANGWEAKIWADAPDWLKIRDRAAAEAFFTGYRRGEEHIPWEAWAQPLFFWSLLVVLFVTASFCVASLLRRQWIENEKFAFPLVALPVLLAEEPEPGRRMNTLLRNPLLWVGVALTTVLHTVKGLHLLYPSIPDIRTFWDVMEFMRVAPWNQLGWFSAHLYPLVIGMTFLLPAEVAFSFWFFFLFYKLEIFLCAVYNWDMPGAVGGYSQKQFHSLQAFGGAVGLFSWTLWTARRHLRDVWEKATGGPRAASIDDSGEMLSYRAAVIGLALSYGGIAAWLIAAKVSVLLIALSLLIMTLSLVVISWVVCQGGMLFMQTPYSSIDVLAPTVGTAPFPIAPLYTVYRFEGSFVYDTREMLIPSILNGAKTADAARFRPGPLMAAMALSVAVGLVVSAVASLWLPYHNGGALSLPNRWSYDVATQMPLRFFGGVASVPQAGTWTNGLHILGGFVGVLGLLVLRSQIGWGLHPIGFLGSSVHAVHMLWFSIFLGWLFKVILLRYGGMKGYTLFLPFFLGLVLGDVLNAVVWMVLGYLTQTGYNLMPG
jgi:hypothetical protein